MAGSVQVENSRIGGTLMTSREPVGPKRAGDKGSTGDQAVMDAVLIVGACWAFLLLLAWSLRNHNI